LQWARGLGARPAIGAGDGEPDRTCSTSLSLVVGQEATHAQACHRTEMQAIERSAVGRSTQGEHLLLRGFEDRDGSCDELVWLAPKQSVHAAEETRGVAR
jgi:hypothetical protein